MKGYTVAKLLFLICNCIFWAMGIVIFVLGVYVKLEKESYLQLLPSNEGSIAVSLAIAAGILVFTTGVIGFLAIWMKNQCMLLLYFIIVLVIFALELAAGVIAIVYWQRLNESNVKLLEWKADFKTTLENAARRPYWDYVQRDLECCGVTSYTDWYRYANLELPFAVPDSCCQVEYVGCGEASGQLAWQEGCYTKLKDKLLDKDSVVMIAGAGIALGILQIAVMVFAGIFWKCLRDENK